MPDPTVSMEGIQSVTQLLAAAQKGDQAAMGELYLLVEAELRKTAESLMRRERPDHSLQPTLLINEAFLRLLGGDAAVTFNDRVHFYRIAAVTMRRILIESARRRNGKPRRVALSLENLEKKSFSTDHEALHEALRKLEELDPIKADIINLRFYCGLTIEETAMNLDVSPSTVKAKFRMARAWLCRELTHAASEK